jgi:hypothetical protein
MGKMEILDSLLQNDNGFLKASDAVRAGISRTYLSTYVRERGLERVAQGLYTSPDAWDDGMYIMLRYALCRLVCQVPQPPGSSSLH